ncbi:MAG TPA: hypothetical protein VII90_08315 [Anaerolineales bacterium]
MKNIRIISITALLFAFSIVGCSARAPVPASAGKTTATFSPGPTKTSVSTLGTSFLAVGVLPSINRLSPSSFVKDGATFEAIAYIRQTCLKVEIEIKSDYPISSPSQAASFEPVEDITLFSGSTGVPLVVIPEGRGGGGGSGGPPGAWYQLSRDFLYDVRPALSAGGFVALVTFDRSFGIAGPARFDIQPVARPNLYCPQLPPTTPEG